MDPLPGPRSLGEVRDVVVVHPAVGLAGPATSGPSGFRFAESRMAELLGEQVVLVDPGGGPALIAEGIAVVAARLDCDLVLLVDVGGDALAHGGEAGLASPLCDAVMLAASAPLALHVGVLGVVLGAGCDGELTPGEVLARLAELAAAGGLLGSWGLTPAAVAALAAAVEAVPTEASAQALECARGALGPAPIRGGRRTVERSPLGAIAFIFDPATALRTAARLAAAVRDCRDLLDARSVLAALGVRTELDLEEEAALDAGVPGG